MAPLGNAKTVEKHQVDTVIQAKALALSSSAEVTFFCWPLSLAD